MTIVGLISADDLRTGPATQVVDARTRSEFEAGHIPGAVWMGWEEWCDIPPAPAGSILHEPGYWGVLLDAPREWYHARLEELGLSGDQPIVVYAGGPSSRGREGRIGWMLLYLGALQVLLLNGGWPEWVRNGGIETSSGQKPRGHFTGTFHSYRRRSVQSIARHWDELPGTLFVDTRSPEEYAGGMQEYLPRCGHVPGAVLIPFLSLFNEHGLYVTREQYLDLVPATVQNTEDVVVYCEVGIRASLFALLHEIHTGQVIPVCDGSLVEWSVSSSLPLEISEVGMRSSQLITQNP